jgi:hypothetical protein
MNIRLAILGAGLLAVIATLSTFAQTGNQQAGTLKPPSAFDSIADREARSIALFNEAAKVILSPRCLNCHPSGRSPTQGEDLHRHVPMMDARVAGHGPDGLRCVACHQAHNVNTQGAAIRSIPGHEHWGLAPQSMAWQGKTLAEVCQQIKDRSRNGDRSLDKIREHMGTDDLVGWAWHPGEGRTPAPGTQKEFGALISAWIDTGAFCPGGAAARATQ